MECQAVIGVVVNADTEVGQPGLRVLLSAVSSGDGTQVEIGEAVTGERGAFSIDLRRFGERISSRIASTSTLELRVFDGITELVAHGDTSVSPDVDAHNLVVCVAWPESCAAPADEPPPTLSTSGVYGVVRHQD